MRRFLIALPAALLLLAPLSAQAWQSITTNGSPLYWDSGNPETTWHLSSNYTSNDLTNSIVDSALNAAMNEWSMPGCTSFNAQQGSDRSGNPTNGNQNEDLVGFMESGWPASFGSSTLAVTTPAFWSDGEIIESAMAINAVNHEWVNGNPSNWDQADLQSVAAHEFGHWIGFDHNNYTGSSMTAFYSGGTAERTLTCDDTEGVCSIYASSNNSCTADRYCECGVGCLDGLCNGVPGDDDDATTGDDDDDDDVVFGECSGSPETFSESEPNDWTGEEDVDYDTPGGGDLTISGSLTCGNNNEQYTGDYDWFVIDFPCTDDGRFELDWSGSSSDLDFYTWGSDGNGLDSNATTEYSGPVESQFYAGGRLFFLIVCWDGDSTNYEFKVDWAPFSSGGDDDDDDVADDDDASDDDDDASDDDDDDDDVLTPAERRGGCACDSAQASAAGAGLAGLLVLGLGAALRRRSRRS